MGEASGSSKPRSAAPSPRLPAQMQFSPLIPARDTKLLAEIAAARSKSPVLRLADEEHGRGAARSKSRPSSASLEASLRAITSSGVVSNPTPADMVSIHGSARASMDDAAQSSRKLYEPSSAELPLNTAFRHVMEKSWNNSHEHRPQVQASKGGSKSSSASAKVPAINPKKLLSSIATKYDQYGDYKQQDGHELLRHLLDSLRMEELDVIKKIQPPVPNDTRPRRKSHNETLEESSRSSQFKPLIDNLFCGRLLSCVICEGCRQVSHNYEDFYDISLSLRPETENVTASKRQRIRSMADRWRRGSSSRPEGAGKPVSDTLRSLRSSPLESLSDTEQVGEPVKRSSSRVGRAIIRPRSAADTARIDANSKEGSKTFIKKQFQADENGLESDIEKLSLAPEGRRTPQDHRQRVSSASGAASLLRAVSGRRAPSHSRSASPNPEPSDLSELHKESLQRLHRSQHAHDKHNKGRNGRQQRYLARLLAETGPPPQQPNLSALFWGRRSSSTTTTEITQSDATLAEDVESKQANTGLVRALHQFTSVEVLDGSNSYACKRCWRMLNPPSGQEDEKFRLRRLRRGKAADDSEQSSDDESSSDEEAKERQQRSEIDSKDAGKRRTSISSVHSDVSSHEGQSGNRTDTSFSTGPVGTSESGSSAAEHEHHKASKFERPTVVISTTGDAQNVSTPQAGTPDVVEPATSVETPKPLLRAPKPVMAMAGALRLGGASSDEGSTGGAESSDSSQSDSEGLSQGENPAKAGSIRYADEGSLKTHSDEQISSSAAGHAKHKSIKRKRSAHSLQRRALKRFLIAETPKVFVFHFKRFQATGRNFGSFSSSFKKIDDYVSFPEYLDVMPWIAPPREEYNRNGNLKSSSDPRTLHVAAEAKSTGDASSDDKRGPSTSAENDGNHRHCQGHWGFRRHHRHHRHTGPPPLAGKDVPETRSLYRLYGVVVHQGSMSGGHYTAYVLSDRAKAVGKALAAAGEKGAGPIEEVVRSSTASVDSDKGEGKAKPRESKGDPDAEDSLAGARGGLASVSSLGSGLDEHVGGESADTDRSNAAPSESSHSATGYDTTDADSLSATQGTSGVTDPTSMTTAETSASSTSSPSTPAGGSLSHAEASGRANGSGVGGGSEGRTSPAPLLPARDDRRWIFASDSLVRPASLEEVLKAQAYMLFYERL